MKIPHILKKIIYTKSEDCLLPEKYYKRKILQNLYKYRFLYVEGDWFSSNISLRPSSHGEILEYIKNTYQSYNNK